ncbi:RNA polymerase sigma factor, partial [Pedobacter cryophilus]
GTVKTRIHVARKLLKKDLKAYDKKATSFAVVAA